MSSLRAPSPSNFAEPAGSRLAPRREQGSRRQTFSSRHYGNKAVLTRSGEVEGFMADIITASNIQLCTEHEPLLDVDCTQVTEEVKKMVNPTVDASGRPTVTTHQLDMVAMEISAAAEAKLHPDYGLLAARIFVRDLHLTVPPGMLEATGRSGRLEPAFRAFIARNAAAIDARLRHDRDFGFGYLGIRTMARGYLLGTPDRKAYGGRRLFERPQHAYMRVALALCCGRRPRDAAEAASTESDRGAPAYPEDPAETAAALERAFAYYDRLSSHQVVHASPTMFNAGCRSQQLSSCFLVETDDDMTTIFDMVKEAGLCSKGGGGIGACVSRMRAVGSAVHSTDEAVQKGVWCFNQLLEKTQSYSDQGCKRSGAFAVYLEAWHADVLVFLEQARRDGAIQAEGKAAPELKYGLWVPDLFMETLEAELAERAKPPGERDPAAGNWHLFSPGPDEAPDLGAVYDESPDPADLDNRAFTRLYRRYVAEGRSRAVVKASQVMQAWYETVALTGNPYFLFKDAANRKSNLAPIRTITHSNLCVAGGTMLLTREGQLPIGGLADRDVEVWNGEAWSAVTVRRTAEAARLLRVTLSDGAAVDCTPDHKFYDSAGGEVRARSLGRGLRLEKAKAWPVVEGGEDFPRAYARGLSCAGAAPLRRGEGDTPAVPVNAALDSRLRWFEGYCDGAGRVVGEGASCGVQVRSGDLPFLRRVRLMLQTAGCSPTIRQERPGWLLLVSGTDLWALLDLGFAPAQLDLGAARRPNRDTRRFVRVETVEPLPDTAPTFCFTEPQRGRGVFEGILTGQCAEITIPSWNDEGKPEESETGVCTLGAVNLAAFVRAQEGAEPSYDFEGLAAAAGALTRALDSAIDLNTYPTHAGRRSSLRHRPVGAGVVGLADVFIAMGYAWGSPEALLLDESIHAALYYGCAAESARLARALGPHLSFARTRAAQGMLQPDLWERAGSLRAGWAARVEATTGGFLGKKDWEALRAEARGGMRNGYLTALMPTATSSNALGCNECFEPFTSLLYKRTTNSGEYVILNKHLTRALMRLGLWEEERTLQRLRAEGGSVQGWAELPPSLRRLFRTARELDSLEIVRHAARRGPFTSQSMSLNHYYYKADSRQILTAILGAWRRGLVTGSYYMHTAAAVQSNPLRAQTAAKAEKEDEAKTEQPRSASRGAEDEDAGEDEAPGFFCDGSQGCTGCAL